MKQIKIDVIERQRKDGSAKFKSIRGIGKDNKWYDLRVLRATKLSTDKLPLGRCTIECDIIDRDYSYVHPTFWISIVRVIENDDKSNAYEIKEEDLPF